MKKTNNTTITQDQDPIYSPISESSPSGKDLRYTNIYREIKNARKAEDPSIPQGIWERNIKQADYKKVADLSYTALCKTSKDLQLSAWLIEAWVVSYGVEGLLKGFDVLEGLIKNFWPSIYPKMDDPAAPDARFSPLKWLNEKLPGIISIYIPLAPALNNDSPPLTLTSYLQAQSIEKKILKTQNPDAERIKYQEKNIPSLSDYQTYLGNTPVKYYQDLHSSFKLAKEKLLSIEDYIQTLLPDYVFSFSKIKKIFKSYETIFQPYIAKNEKSDKKNSENPSYNEQDDKTENKEVSTINEYPEEKKQEIAPSEKYSLPTQPLSNSTRDEIYGKLKEIADFLSKTEPHSPAPYLIYKTIAWSNMSLEDIFQEIASQNVELKEFMSWLGMKKSS